MVGEVGVVIEHGDGFVVVDPAGVVLPAEVGCGTAAEIGEGVVLAAEVPEGLPRFAVDVGQGVRVAGADHVVAFFVLFDGVDVEPVPGVVGGAGLADGVVAVVEGEVVGGPPFEEELVRFNVDFLEETVEDEAILGPAKGAQVPWDGDVGCNESGVFFCYLEFVKIACYGVASQVSYWVNLFILSVMLIKLYETSVLNLNSSTLGS